MSERLVSENIDIIVKAILNMFYVETNMKQIDVQIEFVDDLYNRRLELAKNEKDRVDVINSEEFISGFNGTMVLPLVATDKPTILIAKSAIDDNGLFIGTVIHELTHIHDYYDFAALNEILLLSKVPEHKDFSQLYQWSEYHARRYGYYFYSKLMYSLQEPASLDDRLNYIKNTECTFQYDYLKGQLCKYENEATQYIYNIMQFLGRYSVWQDLFPNDINENSLPKGLLDVFGNRIIEIYKFLYIKKTFDDMVDKFDELKYLLSRFVIF